MRSADRRTVRRLIAIEQLVLARYEIAEASVLDPVVAERLGRLRQQRRGMVYELLALVDGYEVDAAAPAHHGAWSSCQEAALALLRQAEQHAVDGYDAVLSDCEVGPHHESFAQRIVEAQRAIDWFDRLAASMSRAPLA